MNEGNVATRSVVVEREMPHPPEKIWRALTQQPLLQDWLMQTDFEPVLGRSFTFSGDWGSVECRVLTVEPCKTLAYTWAAMGLDSVVTWTLTASGTGTLLRMEQTGFLPDQTQAFQGAKFGWAKFVAQLDSVLAKTN